MKIKTIVQQMKIVQVSVGIKVSNENEKIEEVIVHRDDMDPRVRIAEALEEIVRLIKTKA